jgi:hypothetical protein
MAEGTSTLLNDNNIVARVTPNRTLTVVAGNGQAGFSGDGEPATSATLNGPTGVAVDSTATSTIWDVFFQPYREVSGGTIMIRHPCLETGQSATEAPP